MCVSVCVSVCVLRLSRKKVRRMVSLFFFQPPPSSHWDPETESRLSPRWGIHKLQQMKTKCFQLPSAAGNGSAVGVISGMSDRVCSRSCSSVLAGLQRLYLHCHLSAGGRIRTIGPWQIFTHVIRFHQSGDGLILLFHWSKIPLKPTKFRILCAVGMR